MDPVSLEELNISIVGTMDSGQHWLMPSLINHIIKVEKECAEDDLIKIEGELKNPKFKPWTKVNPE